MEPDDRATKRLKTLLESQKLAVLATHLGGQPYGSLVCFASAPDGRELFFATTRATRKYANLSADDRVALVVDNRSNQDSDIHEATALTAVGRVEELSGQEREHLEAVYLTKHPYLKDFVKSPTCAFLRVTVETYYLVCRFQEVTELKVSK